MKYGEQSWPTIASLTHKVVVVPLGAVEQHGHHLPLLTDSLIGSEVARRTEAALDEEAIFLPILWLGASDHHQSFPGAVSLSVRTYIHVLTDVLESLIGSGFRRILLLNAHAGNIVPAQIALSELQIKYRAAIPNLWLTFTSWFEIAQGQAAAVEGLTQPGVIHACEWETSMVMCSHPQLVTEDERPSTHILFKSDFYAPDFSKPSRIYVARTIEQVSASGAFGYPEYAASAKGEALYAAATREVVTFIREFADWPASLRED